MLEFQCKKNIQKKTELNCEKLVSEKMFVKAFVIQFIFIVVRLASGDDDVEHRGELNLGNSNHF